MLPNHHRNDAIRLEMVLYTQFSIESAIICFPSTDTVTIHTHLHFHLPFTHTSTHPHIHTSLISTRTHPPPLPPFPHTRYYVQYWHPSNKEGYMIIFYECIHTTAREEGITCGELCIELGLRIC